MKSDGVVNTVDLATVSPNPEDIYVDPVVVSGTGFGWRPNPGSTLGVPLP